MNLSILQNGSDIRGISLTGVPGEEPNLTQKETGLLTKGFLLWLAEKAGKAPDQLKVAIGRDPRLSGKLLMQTAVNALGQYGVEVLDCGIASTPAMFMSTRFPQYDCDGAIMLTASHLPYNRNGFKYFSKEGGLDKEDIRQIIEYAEEDVPRLGEPTHEHTTIRQVGVLVYPSTPCDLMDTYSAHLRSIIVDGLKNSNLQSPDGDDARPLEGLKIVVNAGNGSGGFYATDVLKPLGADISASRYLEPDGGFPHHAPNPEDPEAITSTEMAVIRNGADLGLIFDTDVDRSAAVDHLGRGIARDGIVALASALVAERHPGSTVVTDSITSNQLTSFLEKDLGLKHFRYMRGYKNVINKAKEIPDAYLAIETSGHAAFRDNYFLDDGAYLATLIVIKTAALAREGKALNSLLSSLKSPAEEREVRIPITAPDFSSYGDEVLANLESWTKTLPAPISLASPNYEGVRINFDDGWCLLRKSLHDPIMPLNIASDREGGVKEIAEILRPFLERYPLLDIAKL